MTDTLADLFVAQAARTPHNIALAWDGADGRMRYAELDRRSDGVAGHLHARGIGVGDCVAIRAQRHPDAFVATLGVMKAGAACVPLDPSWPTERLAGMLDDCRAAALLTQRSLPTLATIVPTAFIDEVDGDAAPPIVRAAGPDDLAYVIYTSGSTGRPKGVAMVHRAIVALVAWQNGLSPLALPAGGSGVLTAAFSSFSFDVSFQEMFTTWGSGGTLVIIPETVKRDPRAMIRLLQRHGVHRLYLPYVALRQLAEAADHPDGLPHSLTDVVTAGEQLKVTPRLADLFRRLPACRLHNHYGPSETHVITAWTLPDRMDEWPALPPIGHAVNGTRLYLLDTSLREVAPGEVGELYAGGACLARGYLHRPDLTAERFVHAPGNGERVYRTGDLARRLPDGAYEFLGRADDQVKIRGYRVEPAEVETLLSAHPAVLDCAVLARDDVAAERVLVAYVLAADRGTTATTLREHLARRAADYMIPSAFVFVDAFPQTATGKVDRRALPSPSLKTARLNPMVTARTELERTVVRIWEEVLGTSPIGVTHRYADLGGSSVLFVRIVGRLEDVLGREIALGEAFQHDTPEALAAWLSDQTAGDGACASDPLLAAALRRGGQQRKTFRESET